MKFQLMATKMRELTASRQYRKGIKEMNKMQSQFSEKTFIMLTNLSDETVEMFENEGFVVERTKIPEYKQFKVSW